MASGGEADNSIASKAVFNCECRSNNREQLKEINDKLLTIFDEAKSDNVSVTVECVGSLPCAANVDEDAFAELMSICKNEITECTGNPVWYTAATTECNIPMSLGIPSLTLSVAQGAGIHTREEWLDKKSLPLGLEMGIRYALAL